MKTYSIYEAKARLSAIVDAVIAGEECIVSRHGEPVVVMIPYRKRASAKRFGLLKGQVKFYKGWDEPLTEEELADWGL